MDRYVKRKGTQKKSAAFSKKSKYLLSTPFPFKKKFDFGKSGHLVNVICRNTKTYDKYYEKQSESILIVISVSFRLLPSLYPIVCRIFVLFWWIPWGEDALGARGTRSSAWWRCRTFLFSFSRWYYYCKECLLLKGTAILEGECRTVCFFHRNPLFAF